MVGPIPHPAHQSMHDPLYPPGQQWYWKADFVRTLPDEAIAVLRLLLFFTVLSSPGQSLIPHPLR